MKGFCEKKFGSMLLSGTFTICITANREANKPASCRNAVPISETAFGS